ncbi:ferritin light chain, oocyte isoform-like isoform X2 [Platichthys flesus]|uniref:ferritin light chain, oocyte isoform-like isoform X2 n=1 Tax=Platichthys flesus TaxID=8260 RepID=UPI002DB7E045|nr:ferritin light chain, oocyte isoform-like isoform X2 [Platichthys flesus]
MAEPPGKKLRSSLPQCSAHPSSGGSSRVRQNLPAAVEEALCGVGGLMWDRAYKLQALEALKQQAEAEAMLGYLAERGGKYCSKDIQKPGCEAVCAVLPALELLLLQLKEEAGALVELSQLAREHGDPHTASVVKSHFLAPRVDRLKLLGDLLTSARRIGCISDQTRGFGEYILNELQEELPK